MSVLALLRFIIMLGVIMIVKCKDDCYGLGVCIENKLMINISDFPINEKEIEETCEYFTPVFDCVDSWKTNCLSKTQKESVDKLLSVILTFTRMMCSHQIEFREEYLKENKSFEAVRTDMKQCINAFQDVINHATNIENSMDNIKLEVCCAWFKFNQCMISSCATKCTPGASMLLRRILSRLSLGTFKKHCKDLEMAKRCP